MERVFLLLTLITPFLFSSICFSEQEEAPLQMNCSLYVARANGGAPVVNISDQPVFLGYSDPLKLNDLQPMFILSELAPETAFLQRRAVLARFFLTAYGQKVLSVGFYSAQKRFGNSLNLGVLEHPHLTSWQFEPIYIDEFYFQPNDEVSINIDFNDHVGQRITGNTNYSMVSLSCSN